jgi:hypothetical protein
MGLMKLFGIAPTDEIKVGDLVFFQAYEDSSGANGRVKRIGTSFELGRFTIDTTDPRIFYEVESVGERYNFVFTVTTKRWLTKIN